MPPPSLQSRSSRVPFVSDGYIYEEHIRSFNLMQERVARITGKPVNPRMRIELTPGENLDSSRSAELTASQYSRLTSSFTSSGRRGRGRRSKAAGWDPDDPDGPGSRTIEDDDLLDYLTTRAAADGSLLSSARGVNALHSLSASQASLGTQEGREEAPRRRRGRRSPPRGRRARETAQDAVQRQIQAQIDDYDRLHAGDGRAGYPGYSGYSEPGARDAYSDYSVPRPRPRVLSGSVYDEELLLEELSMLFSLLRRLREQSGVAPASVTSRIPSLVDDSPVFLAYRGYERLGLSEDLLASLDDCLRDPAVHGALEAGLRCASAIASGANPDGALEAFLLECGASDVARCIASLVLECIE